MDEIIAKVPGESDASVQQRLSEAQAKTPLGYSTMAGTDKPMSAEQIDITSQRYDDAYAKAPGIASVDISAQDEPVDSETTAHPSGVPAHLIFSGRIGSALFTLRNHGYTEVEALIGDLYAGVQKLEAKLRG